jgi:hypothetical protein
MNDTAKCNGFIEGDECLNKERCLRYTLRADDLWQAWMAPSYAKPGVCGDFINNYKDGKENPKAN